MQETQNLITSSYPQKTLYDYIWLTARGFAMGAADVVPGVSGGTMAFILGIYDELIQAIQMVSSRKHLAYIARFQFRQALHGLPWRFLLAVGVGIQAAVFSLAHGLEWALETHPSLLWAFFFGLVFASIFTVLPRIQRWNIYSATALISGTIAAYWIVGLVPSQTPETWWFLFLSGSIAICAMILPGISGSFILVLLGKYEMILTAVTHYHLSVLFWVSLGSIVGLVTFARILGWLFKRYHDVTVAMLIGFMAGSLRKIWPWKEIVESFIDRHGKEVPLIQSNILPSWETSVGVALVLVAIGAMTIISLHTIATRKQESKQTSLHTRYKTSSTR